MLLHYLAKRRNTKIAFSLRCCISALPEFNHLLDFFNLFSAAVDLVINAFSSGLLGGMVHEKGSQERCRNWTALHAQCTTALSSGFPISQGNAEALERLGGKTKHQLICCFLSNTSAKNYRNQNVYVKIIAGDMLDVFCNTLHSVFFWGPAWVWFVICRLGLAIFNLLTEFEVSTSTHIRW